MKLHVFVVYDTKLSAFLKPHHWQVPQQAIRDFIVVANDETTQIHKHPEDFALFQIAEYDDEKGEYTNIKHINHGLASQWIRPKGEPS